MKKLEIIIRPERLDDLKTILNSNGAHGLMISNIMGYGSQRGHKQVYNGVDFGGNLLPKVKVESIVSDETYETIIDQVIEQITLVSMVMARYLFMTYMMLSESVQENAEQTLYNFILIIGYQRG